MSNIQRRVKNVEGRKARLPTAGRPLSMSNIQRRVKNVEGSKARLPTAIFVLKVLCTLYLVLCTKYFVLCTLYFVLCTKHYVLPPHPNLKDKGRVIRVRTALPLIIPGVHLGEILNTRSASSSHPPPIPWTKVTS